MLQFLSSAKLISKPECAEFAKNPIIKIEGADFSETFWIGVPDLNDIDLREMDLRTVNFRGAKLRYADLWGALLNQADFRKADCRDSIWWGAEFDEILTDSETDLRGAQGELSWLRERGSNAPLLDPRPAEGTRGQKGAAATQDS